MYTDGQKMESEQSEKKWLGRINHRKIGNKLQPVTEKVPTSDEESMVTTSKLMTHTGVKLVIPNTVKHPTTHMNKPIDCDVKYHVYYLAEILL